jgi:hypothetical protein
LGDDGRGDGFVDGPVEADDTFLGGEGLAGVLGGGRAGGGRGEGGGRAGGGRGEGDGGGGTIRSREKMSSRDR